MIGCKTGAGATSRTRFTGSPDGRQVRRAENRVRHFVGSSTRTAPSAANPARQPDQSAHRCTFSFRNRGYSEHRIIGKWKRGCGCDSAANLRSGVHGCADAGFGWFKRLCFDYFHNCEGQRPRIVAMTAHARWQKTGARCLAAGMDEYIQKPINADAMLAVLTATPRSVNDQTAQATRLSTGKIHF